MLRPLKRILRGVSELIPNQTVYRSGKIKIIVKDNIAEYSKKFHINLCEFIHHDLLSYIEDLASLTYIVIEDHGYNGKPGRWTGFAVSREDCTASIKAEIVLNYPYNLTLEDAKVTLAHEYGHHWTIFYCLKNHWGSEQVKNQKDSYPRLPDPYYSLRGLSPNIYCHDYTKDWHFCDKEVIAEDYRILFAPTPYNKDHGIIEELKKNNLPMISFPDMKIRRYIEKLR